MTRSSRWAWAIAALAGGAGWLVISKLTGKREAWDSDLYFSWFLPSIWLIIGVLAYYVPERSWRWAFIPFGAQAVVAFVQNPTASLLPLGLMVFAVYGALCLIPAVIGMSIRKRVERRRIA
jgi:peptidoglycan/LPS O-acetylase OafA/YrhL